ncbi:MAG TPA: hypothetical protein VFW33_03475, partial [Gemmataceae bacterium]|nr:hypothetical protein [Gemmataceae bacterium]
GITRRYNRGVWRVGTEVNKPMTREVTLTLSEPPVGEAEAEAAGLLHPEVPERLLREETRRRRIDRLFSAADRLAGQEDGALTPEEVEAEIEAVRRERPGARVSGR